MRAKRPRCGRSPAPAVNIRPAAWARLRSNANSAACVPSPAAGGKIQAEPALPPYVARVELSLDGETWALSAAFADLRPDGLLFARYDDTRAADCLGAWIAHLLLCADPAPGVAARTRGLSRDGGFAFRPLARAQARAELHALLALYREGLVRPLHFFPKSAWACMSSGGKDSEALKKWGGGMRPEFGEANDPAWRLVLRGEQGLPGERFFELARQVLGPLFEHLEDA
ncbi:hypothetical protein [Thauera sp. SDU_THAU2]|uniref:hypothetical protein n=1 Tax=Thauera sp. SDU_THAU2 TaxID=3136633 RepID=UPI00311DB485